MLSRGLECKGLMIGPTLKTEASAICRLPNHQETSELGCGRHEIGAPVGPCTNPKSFLDGRQQGVEERSSVRSSFSSLVGLIVTSRRISFKTCRAGWPWEPCEGAREPLSKIWVSGSSGFPVSPWGITPHQPSGMVSITGSERSICQREPRSPVVVSSSHSPQHRPSQC